MNEARTSQGGSVINFLIVGVLLTAAVLGAVYIVQQRSRDDQPGPVAISPSPTPSATPSDRPSGSPSPSVSVSPSASPLPPGASTGPAPDSVPSTGYLPQTGPTDDFIGTVIPGALLLAAAIMFVRSHRERFGSFHR